MFVCRRGLNRQTVILIILLVCVCMLPHCLTASLLTACSVTREESFSLHCLLSPLSPLSAQSSHNCRTRLTLPVLSSSRWASKPFVLIILCFNFCPRDRPVQFHFVSSQQLELFLWWNIKYWLAELQAPELTPAAPLLQSPVRPLSEMARFLPHLTAEQLLKKHSLILSVFFPPPASDNISDGTVRPHRLTETDCVLYLYLNTLSYRYFFTW